MIISCPNCNKKFNIEAKLIPEKGRLLQCSNCNHKWHYIIPSNKNEIQKKVEFGKSTEILNIKNDKKQSIKSTSNETTIIKQKNKINKKSIDKTKNKNLQKNTKKKNVSKKYSIENFLKNIIIIIITFGAMILILDTFKISISNYIPIIIPFLDSFYQTIYDLNSFIKDLIS